MIQIEKPWIQTVIRIGTKSWLFLIGLRHTLQKNSAKFVRNCFDNDSDTAKCQFTPYPLMLKKSWKMLPLSTKESRNPIKKLIDLTIAHRHSRILPWKYLHIPSGDILHTNTDRPYGGGNSNNNNNIINNAPFMPYSISVACDVMTWKLKQRSTVCCLHTGIRCGCNVFVLARPSGILTL